MQPKPDEYAAFYAGYVNLVPEEDVLSVLQTQLHTVSEFWRTIPESAATVVHQPYTWNVRQVLDHLTDGERIFGYRLLRIARGDATALPGFDEHFYADASEESAAPLADIADMFAALRQANILLLKNLPEVAWTRMGTMSDTVISVRALAFILAGHVRHHDAILRKRLS